MDTIEDMELTEDLPRAAPRRRSFGRSLLWPFFFPFWLLFLPLRRMVPRSLFGRATLIVVTPLLVTQLVVSWVFYESHWDKVARLMTDAITGEAKLAIEALQNNPRNFESMRENYKNHLNMDMTFFAGSVLDVGATDSQHGTFFTSWLARSLRDSLRKPFIIDTTSFEKQVLVQIQLPEGVLEVILPNERVFTVTTLVVLLWMAGTALVIFAVAVIFMRNQVRPVWRLAKAAERLGKGDVNMENIKQEGAIEIRQAAQAFNAMRTRLIRLMRQRTDMLSGVSHDLRTPLSRMKLQLTMMPSGEETRGLQRDIEEMEQMIEGYLSFARGEGNEKLVPVELKSFFLDLSNKWAQDRRVRVSMTLNHVVLKARPHALARCLDNLVTNARRHGEHVVITLTRRKNNILICIDDDGPGIEEKYRKLVFRPFYRIDHSRNLKTGGSGLGLPIARDIARSHGGDIFLETSPAGGLRALVSLPL